MRRPGVRPVARVLTRPLVAALVFTVVDRGLAPRPLYDLMMRDHDVHIVTHLMFMVTAVIMWWPVMSPVPELPPLPLPARMLYLFLVSLPMQLVAAIITFADEPLYPWYAAAPRTWGFRRSMTRSSAACSCGFRAISGCSARSRCCSSGGPGRSERKESEL